MTLIRSLTLALLAVSSSLRADDPNEDLLAAARKGDLAKVKSLLDNGADVNARSSYNQTPLFFACDRGFIEVAKLLVDRGADVNAEDNFYHFTPLAWSIEKKRPEIVKLLLAHGAKSPAQALLQAARNGNGEIVKIVLEAGKDNRGLDKPALSAALVAATRGKNNEVVEILKGAGATLPDPVKTVQLDPAVLQSYAGAFAGGRGGTEFEFTFTVKDANLSGIFMGQGAITYAPSDKTHFHSVEMDGINIEFLSADSFRLSQGPMTVEFKRKAVSK